MKGFDSVFTPSAIQYLSPNGDIIVEILSKIFSGSAD
jgi:hypothetical protein